MDARYAIILAAGKGTRMKSKLYKVLHPVSGKPMVEHIINRVSETKPDEVITIVGHGAEQVKAQLGERSKYALQAEQLGTGHAVLQAASFLEGKKGTTLVISGDTPLLTTETLNNLFEYHQGKNASATILTAQAENPTGYGRIIRDHIGIVEKIVEQKDATPEEALVQEINTGTYCFDNEALFDALSKVGTNNAQGEYYLTDIIEILKEEGNTVAAYQTDDFEESMGVNDRIALAKANEIMRKRINQMHMVNGVSFVDSATTYIDAGVEIGPDTLIEAGVQIQGNTVIKGTKVGHLTYVGDATLGEEINVGCGVVFVNYDGKNKHHTTVGDHSFIGSSTNIIGPVEVAKNSSIAAGSTITDNIPEYALAIARARQVNKEGYAKKLPYLN